jgi:hypothetical protein
MAGPSVSMRPSSNCSVGTAPLELIVKKSSPVSVFLVFESILTSVKGKPASSSTMCGDSAHAPVK